MKLDMNLNLTQEQKLIMTQEMQQSVKILQMSGFELKEYINKELQENPVLDAEYNEKKENVKDDIDYKKMLDYLSSDNENFDRSNYYVNDEEKVSPFAFISQEPSLKDYLFEQITELDEDEYIKTICNYIIENIDKKGYLGNTVENIAKEINCEKQNVEFSLKIVQSFEPYGIAARDLKECLKIQLESKNEKDEILFIIIENYLEYIAENKIAQMAKELNISEKKAQNYADTIKKLEPKPSRGFYTGEEVKYIIPDAYIKKINEEYHIIMNEDVLPRLNVSNMYKNILNNKSNDEKDKKTINYVKEKIDNAMFLMKSIEQRKSTIYRVLEQILKVQKDYFQYGKEYLKPMTLKDISDKLEIHESTVSRAIRDKYIHTDKGTIKIKDLFTTGISRKSGEDVSVIKIKDYIKELIEEEDKKKPLSDQKICENLKKKGMNISRRTVAKYREELGIKSSSKRKRF